MGDGGVSRDGFRERQATGWRGVLEEREDAAVLVAEGCLQMEHLFAGALEAKVARLDHAGVHGADSHLMDRRSLDAKEVLVEVAPHGLIPRVAVYGESQIFG